MNRITKWFRTHKPIDWKYLIILFLSLKLLHYKLVWFVVFWTGLTFYPIKIESEILTEAGTKVGEIYTAAFIRISDLGYDIGQATFPYNLFISTVSRWGIMIIIVVICICAVIHLINVIFYKEDEKNGKRKRKVHN